MAKSKLDLRLKRKMRSRKRIEGSTDRPRLSVYRSPKHVYAQVIDDVEGRTLVSVSSFNKGAKGKAERADIEACTALGKTLAERCKAKNIGKVVFDKNGFTYHGRVKAFADGAREGGLEF